MSVELQDDQAQKYPVQSKAGWKAVILEGQSSNQPAEACKTNQEFIRYLYEQEVVLTVTVTGFNGGGVLVRGQDVAGFIPASHLINLPANLGQKAKLRHFTRLLGKHLAVRVIEYDSRHERVVLSQRVAQSKSGNRKVLLESLKPGDHVKGTITNITDFGVFIDLGGLEGLVHVSELSWGKVVHPRDLFKVGQGIELMVKEVFQERSRVALSLKRLYPNPWEELASSVDPGRIIPAVVTRISNYGVFARLADYGIEGLIHQSSLQTLMPDVDLHSVFQIHQVIAVSILHLEPDKCRLGLRLVI